ncbi:MAG: hypothetical protein IKA10_06955 [Oscillospiraceae bacterium]|nr:hypothetical protein [Oscillospiraceae bacterium]
MQETGADISYAADTAIVEEEKSKNKETASACIKDEGGLLDDEQTQLFYNFVFCYANTLKEIQPTDGIIRLAHISIHIRALYI